MCPDPWSYSLRHIALYFYCRIWFFSSIPGGEEIFNNECDWWNMVAINK